MFQTIKVISILSIVLVASVAHAALIARDSTQTLTYRPVELPIGRSVFGLRTDFIQSSKRLNSQGQKESLGQMFEQKVASADGESIERYEVEASYVQFTPYWGYGLTSSWSLYFGLPIYQVKTRTIGTETNALTPGLEATSTANTLTRRSPDSPQNEASQMLVGQAVLSAQYLVIDGIDHKLGFTQRLRFPSAGRDDSIYFTHGVPEALGYGLGVGLNYEYAISSGFNFISSAEGLINFNDDVFIQQNINFKEVDRDPGETLIVSTSLEKSIFTASYFQVGVSLEQKTADELEIKSDNDEAYAAAEAQRLLLAYEYRPAGAGRAAQESLLSSRVSYSYLLSGDNVAAENAAAVELRITY